MAWLKVYEWERAKWPEFQEIKVHRFQQGVLLEKLARHFKVSCPDLMQSNKRGANANSQESGAAGSYHRSGYGVPTIRLGMVTTLGTLLHEFAHHLNWVNYRQHGHGRKFKRELKRTYTWGKRYLPKMVVDSSQAT